MNHILVATWILAFTFIVASFLQGMDRQKLQIDCLHDGDTIKRFQVRKGEDVLTYSKVMSALREDAQFQGNLITLLRRGLRTEDDDLTVDNAYFFETPPVSSLNYDSLPFEFVLVSARSLNGVPPDTM